MKKLSCFAVSCYVGLTWMQCFSSTPPMVVSCPPWICENSWKTRARTTHLCMLRALFSTMNSMNGVFVHFIYSNNQYYFIAICTFFQACDTEHRDASLFCLLQPRRTSLWHPMVSPCTCCLRRMMCTTQTTAESTRTWAIHLVTTLSPPHTTPTSLKINSSARAALTLISGKMLKYI